MKSSGGGCDACPYVRDGLVLASWSSSSSVNWLTAIGSPPMPLTGRLGTKYPFL